MSAGPAVEAIETPLPRKSGRRRLARFLAQYGPLVGLAVLMAAMAVATPQFLSLGNLTNLARQVSINAIIAAGMTFVIVTGGIDLSVGSLVALTGCVGMLAIDRTGWDPAGLLVALLVGAAAGAANGAAVAWGRMPPFLATLAGLTVFRGLALVATAGSPVIRMDGGYRWIGQGFVLGVPVPVVLMVLVMLALHVLLTRTAFGAHVYAVGGNEEASRLSGVAVTWTRFWVYVLCGLLTGLAGMILAARLSSAQPNTGEGFELDAIAAVVLGGTSLMGGRGTVWGTVVGAFVTGVLNNGFNLLAVDAYYQLVAKGLIIVLAVLLDQYLKQRI
jgi:ribose transport system permease protein